MRNVNRSVVAPAAGDASAGVAWHPGASAGHYATEIRRAHGLAQGAESLTRYPNPRVRVLDAAERAGEGAAHSARARKIGVPGDRAGDEEWPTL